MRTPLAALAGALLFVAGASAAAAGEHPRVILALGDATFLNPAAVQQATGAEVKKDPSIPLKEVALLLLANTPFTSLPPSIQDGLPEYIRTGGAALLTGGPQAFGSGGYQSVADLLPFQLRSQSDWRNIPHRFPVVVRSGHPVIAGVAFISIQAVNDMNPRPDATEILQTAGGGSAGGGMYPYPLMAEIGVGAGRVIGMAFDLNDFAGMRDRDLFIQNTLSYLLAASRAGLGQ